MEIKNVKISELIPAEYNPRQMTQKQKQDLKNSLSNFGFIEPVVVNSNPDRLNVIIGGHQRVTVWKSLGQKEVPTVHIDLSPEKEKELNIRLNRNLGDWDWEMIQSYFDKSDLIEWGFEEVEFKVETLDPEVTDGDGNIPEISGEIISSLGDIYDLGKLTP